MSAILSVAMAAGMAASGTQALFVFLADGLGMALVVSGATVVIASGRRSVVERIRSFGRGIDLVPGWVMLLAGAFIVWYWATELSVGALAVGSSPVVRWVDELSASITGFDGRNVPPVAIGLAVLLGMGLLIDRRRRAT